MGVFVAVAVADIFHEASDGVAELKRNGVGFGLVDIFQNGTVPGIERVGFWRERKIDGGLREGEMAFGRAEEIESVFGC